MLRIVDCIFGCGDEVLGERMVLEMLKSRGESEWSKYRIRKQVGVIRNDEAVAAMSNNKVLKTYHQCT